MALITGSATNKLLHGFIMHAEDLRLDHWVDSCLQVGSHRNCERWQEEENEYKQWAVMCFSFKEIGMTYNGPDMFPPVVGLRVYPPSV